MSDALSARNRLKLNEKEFALLLGVPVTTVIVLEQGPEHRGGIADSLFVLLAECPSRAARVLLENRIASTAAHTTEARLLADLSRKLHAERII